ncbi:MAG: hypothetical protein MN733_28330, partial [Nitrososphaera sp.]|nr:hypothetical protein [Nitrososphaera sp.]
HVPAGWGALGIMLDELTSAVANGTTIPAFSTVVQVRGRQQLLPYLREVDRLKYESVLVVPVTNPTAPLALLRGAIAFYLHRADCLPAESGEFAIRVSKFSQLLQDHVQKHVSSLNPRTFKTLGQIWWDDLKSHNSSLRIGLLDINVEGLETTAGSQLDEIVHRLVDHMGGSQYHCVPGPDDPGPNWRRVLVAAPLDVQPQTLRTAMLTAAGHACVNVRLVHYRCSVHGTGVANGSPEVGTFR